MCKVSFRWSGVVVVWCGGFGVVTIVMFFTLLIIVIMWCQVFMFKRANVCAYQESKKCVDVEEGQLQLAPSPNWVEGATCVHQVCVFRLMVLGLVNKAMCVRGEVVSKDEEWNDK